MALQIMESQQQGQGVCQGTKKNERLPTAVYDDWYFNENVELNKNREFAHIAARWISFIGVGGTAQRTNIKLNGGRSQFQDQRGNNNDGTHAAHQVQACIDITNNRNNAGLEEVKNRLGHTDVIPRDLNESFGTVIDNIQNSVLDANLLDKDEIDFSKGYTKANEDAARVIQGMFIKGVRDKLTSLGGPVTSNDDDYVKDKVLLRSLLEIAGDIYNSTTVFYEGLEAGINNFQNELTFPEYQGIGTMNVETTLRTVRRIDFLPNVTDDRLPISLASKEILGIRRASGQSSGSS